jgi:hypothetical protein
MAKRHTAQNEQQKLGQYFTTNSDTILEGFEDLVVGKHVVDPFAGQKDLLRWAEHNGAASVKGYDLVPQSSDIIRNDSLKNPTDYTGLIVVSNPPYLSRNKTKGDKSVFDQWNQNDYYKCHLASLASCDEAIVIVPANFFCESSDRIRKLLFKTHSITKAKFWTEPAFDDATVSVTAFHMVKKAKPYQDFPCLILPENTEIRMILRQENNYLHGDTFFDYIQNARDIAAIKTDVGMPAPNTNLVVGLLDNGKWKSGISYNSGEPVYTNPKSFTTYQLTLPEYTLTEEQQQRIAVLFDARLIEFRKKYHSMFLSNYMGPNQKILSRSIIKKLLGRVMDELDIPDPKNGMIKQKQQAVFSSMFSVAASS